MRPILMLLTYCLFITVLSAHAAVYTWKDEKGQTVFSQTPQRGATKVDVRPTPPGSDESNESKSKTTDDFLKEIEASNAAREQARAEAAKAAQEKAAQKQACADARRSMELLNQGGTTRYKQPDGSYSTYSQQKKAEEREKMQNFIREQCN